MSGGSKTQTATTTQSSEPWEGVQGHLVGSDEQRGVYDVAADYAFDKMNNPDNYIYQGPTNVGLSADSKTGLGGLKGLASAYQTKMQYPLQYAMQQAGEAYQGAQGDYSGNTALNEAIKSYLGQQQYLTDAAYAGDWGGTPYGDAQAYYKQLAGEGYKDALGDFSGSPYGDAQKYYRSNLIGAEQARKGQWGDTGYGDAQRAYQDQINGLFPIAQGDFSSDNIFTKELGTTLDDVTDRVNLNAAGHGRYGSGIHQDTLTKSLADAENSAKLQRMNWANDQMSKYGELAGSGEKWASSLIPQYGELMGNAEVRGANQAAQFGELAGSGQKWATDALAQQNSAMSNADKFYWDQLGTQGGALQQLYEQAQAPSQSYMNIGSVYEDALAKQYQDEQNRWNQYVNYVPDTLNWYNAILSGGGQLGGSSTSSVTTPDTTPSWGQTALGYGTQALLGSLFF